MKKTLTILFLALAISASAKVDLAAICDSVSADQARFTALTNRFLVGDTTLTINEKCLVYYGSACGADFNPDAEYPALDRAYASTDWPRVLLMAEQALTADPCSLDLTIKALTAATQVDGLSQAKAETYRNRYWMLQDAIMASGMGLTPESPWILHSPDDEARWLRNVLRVNEIMERTTIQGLDAVKVKMNETPDPVILYFSIIKK
ncbi:MAG: DUF4919 domain-containing protein [Bacteroidales bacterium]|nr:DUF4919 domain-containing protein [Bacteroidales bacterium]MCD8394659.1 DUF4919 domain-containing protein [Bacteroidales bacterium]